MGTVYGTRGVFRRQPRYRARRPLVLTKAAFGTAPVLEDYVTVHAAHGNETNADDFVLSATPNNGDVLVLFGLASTESRKYSVPAGWTEFKTASGGGGWIQGMYRIADSEADGTFSFNPAATFANSTYTLMRFSGAVSPATTALVLAENQQGASGATTWDSPAATHGASVAARVIRGLVSAGRDITGTNPPGGMTQFVDSVGGSNSIALAHHAADPSSVAAATWTNLPDWHEWTYGFTLLVHGTGGGGGASYTLPCTSGSYTLTGNAAGLFFNRTVAATAGSYALTGQTVNLLMGRKVSVDSGTYVLTGNSVTFALGKAMLAVSGSYTLTGNDVSFPWNRRLTAVAGSYTLSGNNANLLFGRRIEITSSTYALTGNAVVFAKGVFVSATAGSYSLTGNAVTFPWNRRLTAESGTYAITGNATGLLFNRRVTAVSGVYTLTGNPVAFTTGKGMQAASGSYALSGQPVAFSWARRLEALSGSFSLSGQPVGLLWARRMAALAGVYSLTGQPTGLLWGHRVSVTTGSYVLTGAAVSFPWAHRLLCTAGVYTLTGNSVALVTAGQGIPISYPLSVDQPRDRHEAVREPASAGVRPTYNRGRAQRSNP